MNYRHEMRISFLLLASSFLGAPVLAGTNEAHAAAVLFKNFETVFHTTPALLSGSSNDVRSALPSETFGYLLAALDAIGPQVRANVLENSEAILVGTKDYRPPIGLGPVRSTRCYVIVLRKESALNLSQYFKKVETALAAGGAPVWYWSAELGEFGEGDPRPSALLAAQMTHSYVLVSNDLDDLLNISGHLASTNNDARVFAGVREWNSLSQHEFWGYRKFKHEGSSFIDTLSARFIGQITPEAEAATFYVDTKRGTGVLRIFSSSSNDTTAKNMNATGAMPPLKAVGPRTWETVFPLAEESVTSVLWLFGWGVLV
jgi:hypothetical protein